MKFFILLLITTLTIKSYAQSELMLLPVKINGEKMNFIFDNASEISLIFEKKLSKKIKKAPKEYYIIGANNDTTLLFRTKDKVVIELSGMGIKYKIFMGIINTPLPDLFNENIAGILGADIINQLDWKLDFKNKKVEVLAKKEIITISDHYKIDFDKGYNTMIDITSTYSEYRPDFTNDSINKTYPIQIDLGCTCYIELQDSSQIFSSSLLKFSLSHSLGSAAINRSNILPIDMFLGDMSIKKIPVSIGNENLFNLLGINFFALFDYMYLLGKEHRIFLPKKNAVKIELSKVRILNKKLVSVIVSDEEEYWMYRVLNKDLDTNENQMLSEYIHKRLFFEIEIKNAK